MAVFVLFFSGLLNSIPRAALAALLIHVGVNLVKVGEIKKVARFGELVRTRQHLGSCLSLTQGIKGDEHKAKKARPHPDRRIANFMDPI